MKKFSRFIASLIFSLLVYLLLTYPFNPDELLLGAITSVFTALLTISILPVSLQFLQPKRILLFLAYIPYFLWKMIESNIAIALIVINPKLPVSPSILKGKTKLETLSGKLILTSSITLTPGTLSIDVDDKTIYIHSVTTPKNIDTTEQNIIEPFENKIRGYSE